MEWNTINPPLSTSDYLSNQITKERWSNQKWVQNRPCRRSMSRELNFVPNGMQCLIGISRGNFAKTSAIFSKFWQSDGFWPRPARLLPLAAWAARWCDQACGPTLARQAWRNDGDDEGNGGSDGQRWWPCIGQGRVRHQTWDSRLGRWDGDDGTATVEQCYRQWNWCRELGTNTARQRSGGSRQSLSAAAAAASVMCQRSGYWIGRWKFHK